MELRRRSSTPQDAASRAPRFGNSLRIAPRETSGTEGSNPSSSSGESANLRSRFRDEERIKRVGDVGRMGIIRSPVRASILLDCGGRPVMGVPTAIAISDGGPWSATRSLFKIIQVHPALMP